MAAPSKLVSLRVPMPLMAEIEATAKAEGRSRTAEMVRRLGGRSVEQSAGRKTTTRPYYAPPVSVTITTAPQASCRHGRVMHIMGGLRCADCGKNI